MTALLETRPGGGSESYYVPATAQFLTPEPLFALTVERYSYAGNDPMNGDDPLGLWYLVHNSSGGCKGSGVVKKASGTAISHATGGQADCVRYVTCSSATESLAHKHKTTTKVSAVLDHAGTDYLWGPGGLAVKAVTGTTVTDLHTDGLGTVRLGTDAGGAVAFTQDFDAWGNPTGHTGTPPAIGYKSQLTDPETGLIYLRARYYDPVTAQFLTPDPLFALTGERYGYAGNDPINSDDPMGLWCVVHNSQGGCAGSGVLKKVVKRAAVGAANMAQMQPDGLLFLGLSKATGKSYGGCVTGDAAGVGDVSGSLCYVQAPNGDHGFTATTGDGVGTPDLGLGITGMESSGRSLSDQGGPFDYVNGSAGAGVLSGGGGYSWGKNSCGTRVSNTSVGWTPNYPLPYPGAVSGGGSYTWIFGANGDGGELP